MRTTICALLIAVLLCCEHSLVSSKRRKKSTDSSNQTKIYHPSKPRWPAFSSQTNINWESIYELTKKPTNRVLCKIFCRSGYHVQILSNGLVRGTVNQSSKYSKFCVLHNMITWSVREPAQIRLPGQLRELSEFK